MDGVPFGKLCALSTLDPNVSEGLAAVRAYWEGLRDGGCLPFRSAIDPRGLSGALDRVFLAERIGPGLAQIRLSGNRINEIAGIDGRGLPLSCLFEPSARAGLSQTLERVFLGPRVADLHLTAVKDAGRPMLFARLLLLPLYNEAGESTLVLGCFGFGGELGRLPRRFEISRASEDTLSPAGEPRPIVAAPVPSEKAVLGRGHLRLIYSAG